MFFIHDIDFIIINEFSNDDKKFSKLSSSNKFTKKKNENLTFFDWLLKIQNCLFVNVDHYFTSKHNVIFIINRIFDYASNHINVYREKKLNYFKISKQVLTFFRDIYENRNATNNARREFKTFRMKSHQIFDEFFSNFRRFVNILDFSFQFQLFDFQNKIVQRFRDAFIIHQKKYDSLKNLRIFLQKLNDSQRYNLKIVARFERKRIAQTNTSTIIASIKFVIVVVSRNVSVVIFAFKSAIVVAFHRHNNDISIVCFHCDKQDHIRFDYSNLDKSIVTRIHEIVNEFDEKMKKIFEQVDEKTKKV